MSGGAAPDDRSEASISSSKQTLQIFLGLGGFRRRESFTSILKDAKVSGASRL